MSGSAVDQRWIFICDTNGKLDDPADGTPALQKFYRDGTPETISHYTNDELVSEESFPPPIGEA